MNLLAKETLLSLICFALAGLVYSAADQIPPSLLAQVSAGLVPKLLAVCLALLAAINLVLVVFRTTVRIDPPAGFVNAGHYRMLVLLILLGLFTALLDQGLLRFPVAALAFVFTATLVLSRPHWRAVLIAAAIALLSVGLTVFVFTRVFTVILP